jgi:hypothetical protein
MRPCFHKVVREGWDMRLISKLLRGSDYTTAREFV